MSDQKDNVTKDPITELSRQFGEFIEASDKRFAAIEDAITDPKKDDKKKTGHASEMPKDDPKEPDADDEKALASVLDSVKQLSAQVEALGKLRQFGTPAKPSPTDDTTSKKPEDKTPAAKEFSFVAKVREFMSGDNKLAKSEAVRKAVQTCPDAHKEFIAAGSAGQSALRSL